VEEEKGRKLVNGDLAVKTEVMLMMVAANSVFVVNSEHRHI